MRLDEQGNPFLLRSLLFSLGVGVALVLLGAYVLYQARFLILGPQIVLSSDWAVEQSQRVISLEGQMFNIVKATLNGRTIYTDERGFFKEALILENGYTIATLEAEDRYGRNTRIEQPFVFVPRSIVTNE